MDPQQPLGHNPYDFIINPPKVEEHPLGGKLLPKSGSNSFILRIAIIVGGAVFLMIIIAVVVEVIFGGNAGTAQYISLVETQEEIVNTATTGGSDVTQTSNQQLAIDVQLSVQTQQQKLVSFLAEHGTTVSPKELQLKINPAVNAQLTQAGDNSTVDVVFAQIMQSQLQSYLASLYRLAETSPNSNERILMSADYIQTQLLLKQVPSTASLQN